MWRYLVFAGAVVSSCLAQSAPSTDIFLVELGESVRVRNLTDRKGYDNQPHFLPGDTAFLYTSQRSGQTDIYRYDLQSGRSVQLTRTPESEYSATPLAEGERFSVIRVEEDGRQRLWSFQLDGSDPQLLFDDLEPVGYQSWPSRSQVVTFILGSPPTLQLADLESQESEILARNIGRCLKRVPGTDAISYISKAENPWMIRKWNAVSGVIENVVPVLQGSEDYAWSADGELFMGRGSRLYRSSSEEPHWQLLADLADQGVDGITRLDVSADGKTIVLVADAG